MKKHHQFGAVCGNDSSFANKTDYSVTDGIDSKYEPEPHQPFGNARPTGDVNNRQSGNTLETLRANTDKMEAFRLTNQRLLRELEELTRQLRCPREAHQALEGDTLPQEERRHLDAPRDAKGEEETS